MKGIWVLGAMAVLLSLAAGLPQNRQDQIPADWIRGPPPSNIQPPPKRLHNLASSMFDFQNNLIKTQRGAGNTILSPLSIVTLLNMLLMGSTGNTHAQLRYVLQYPLPETQEARDKVHRETGAVIQYMKRDTPGARFSIGNRIFLAEGLNVQSNYMTKARDFYKAGVEIVPFSSDPVVAQNSINQWISAETNGLIDNLLDSPLPRTTRMVATNAIFFNGSWEFPFDPKMTKKLTFHHSAESSEKVDTMVNTLLLPYADLVEDKMRVLALPYYGLQYAMYLFVPDGKGVEHLDELETKLNSGFINYVFSQLKSTNVSVYLPTFKMEHTVYLRDALQEMGATDMFQESRASLERLSTTESLFVDDVIHQAVIEVTERGTVAAASTSVLVSRDRFIPEFRCNRPFLFAIMETSTKVPLFWGRVVNPQAP